MGTPAVVPRTVLRGSSVAEPSLAHGALAALMSDRGSVVAVERHGFREYYNPLTGHGLGARDFSWSTLLVDC